MKDLLGAIAGIFGAILFGIMAIGSFIFNIWWLILMFAIGYNFLKWLF